MDRRTARIAIKQIFSLSRVAESFPVYLKAKTAILNNSTPRPELLSNFGLDKEAVGHTHPKFMTSSRFGSHVTRNVYFVFTLPA